MILSMDRPGRLGAGSDEGIPPNFVPMVSMGSARSAVATAASPTAISMPGQCGRQRRSPRMVPTVATESDGGRSDALPRRPQGRELLQQLARFMVQRQPEELLDLTGEDDDRDPGRETDRHRKGDELDEGAQAQEPGCGQHQTRQKGREDQPIHSVQRDSAGDQHDEGAGRAADLEARAAEHGDEEAAHDCGVEPLRRCRARRDGDGHRKRQRHDGDCQPRNRVRAQLRQPVALAQDRQEFRGE